MNNAVRIPVYFRHVFNASCKYARQSSTVKHATVVTTDRTEADSITAPVTQFQKVDLISQKFDPVSIPNVNITADEKSNDDNIKDLAKEHFHLLLNSEDIVEAHVQQHKNVWKLSGDVNYTFTKFTEAENLQALNRIGIVTSIARLLLDMEPDQFERLVVDRQSKAMPVMELSSCAPFNCSFNEYMRLLSFLVLLKERRHVTFQCLTRALVYDMERKSHIAKMEDLVQLMIIVYRLSPEFFNHFLETFVKRCSDILLEPIFPPNYYAIYCYFLTLTRSRDLKRNQSCDDFERSQSRDFESNQSYPFILKRVSARLRKHFHQLHLNNLGMICYFLNTYQQTNSKEGLKRFALEQLQIRHMKPDGENCSPFAWRQIEIYANSFSVQ